MRTGAVGVVPTGIHRVVSLSAARVTVAPAGSLTKRCVNAMSPHAVARTESPGARDSARSAMANAESSWSASTSRAISGMAVSRTQRARRSRTTRRPPTTTATSTTAMPMRVARDCRCGAFIVGRMSARSSASNASAVGGRCAGSRARQRATSRASARETADAPVTSGGASAAILATTTC